MTHKTIKLYTAEVEYMEIEISPKEYKEYLSKGVPDDVLEKLEDFLLYCSPIINERATLLVDDKEVKNANDILTSMYDKELEKDLNSDLGSSSEGGGKYHLIQERYIKRAWYELKLESKFSTKNLSLKLDKLPCKELGENFVSFNLFYEGQRFQFSDNMGADSSELFLRDAKGQLSAINPSGDAVDEDEASEWIGDEEAALAEMIEAGRDDWDAELLQAEYDKKALLITLLSDPLSKLGLVKYFRFSKNKKKYFYDTWRKWPVDKIVVDDEVIAKQLINYDPKSGIEIHSHSIVNNEMVKWNNFSEEMLDKYRENTDESLKQFASSRLTFDELSAIECYIPNIANLTKSLDWLEISTDTPAKERDALAKFESDNSNDLLGRVFNSTWSWSGSVTRLVGPIKLTEVHARVIEIRVKQPEYSPIPITQLQFNDFSKKGLPDEAVMSLDWSPSSYFGYEALNPMLLTEEISLYVNGEEVKGFFDLCNSTISSTIGTSNNNSEKFQYILYSKSPEHKRNSWFGLTTYDEFDISHISIKMEASFTSPANSTPINIIKVFYKGVPFELRVWHNSPEKVGAFLQGANGQTNKLN